MNQYNLEIIEGVSINGYRLLVVRRNGVTLAFGRYSTIMEKANIMGYALSRVSL